MSDADNVSMALDYLRIVAFKRGLRHEAARHSVVTRPTEPEPEGDDAILDFGVDHSGLAWLGAYDLGRTAALILAQAELDGASRVQLRFGSGRMVYTLDGADYQMVPAPQPIHCDMVRALARAAGVRVGVFGGFSVRFLDSARGFACSLQDDGEDGWLEITGFSGRPRKEPA